MLWSSIHFQPHPPHWSPAHQFSSTGLSPSGYSHMVVSVSGSSHSGVLCLAPFDNSGLNSKTFPHHPREIALHQQLFSPLIFLQLFSMSEIINTSLICILVYLLLESKLPEGRNEKVLKKS